MGDYLGYNYLNMVYVTNRIMPVMLRSSGIHYIDCMWSIKNIYKYY